MKLELKDKAGKGIGTIEFPVEEVAKSLNQSLSSSLESDAQLHEAQLKESREKVLEMETQLKESQGRAAELEEKLAGADGRTMDDFAPLEKANFVIAWGKGLSPEDKAIFARAVGVSIAGASAAEVAEAEGELAIIQGKTDKEGYKFLEHLGVSVRD